SMFFPNGLDFVGNDLYVADSTGAIFKITPDGNATVWSADPLLAPQTPDAAACGGAVPLAIGANGLVHDANNFYVSNTDFGRILKIARNADGGAGTVTKIVEDCALAGLDGLALDSKDNTIIGASNVKSQIVRVTMSGQISVIASGGPLDNPA